MWYGYQFCYIPIISLAAPVGFEPTWLNAVTVWRPLQADPKANIYFKIIRLLQSGCNSYKDSDLHLQRTLWYKCYCKASFPTDSELLWTIRVYYDLCLSPAIAYPITAKIPKIAPRIAARNVSLPLFSAIL